MGWWWRTQPPHTRYYAGDGTDAHPDRFWPRDSCADIPAIITGGVFFVLYMVNWLVFKDKSYYAAVTATREGSFTRISTQTNHSQWEEPLEEWAQELQPT